MSKKLTHQEFLQYFNQRDDAHEYEFLTEYRGYEKPITVKHCCGHIYTVNASNFLQGRRCNICANHNRKILHPNYMSPQDIRELMLAQPQVEEFEFLEEFDGMTKYIKARHKPCGKIVEVCPKSFVHRNYRCRECSIRATNAEKFRQYKIKFIQHIEGLGYKILDEENFTSSSASFQLQCAKCNKILTTTSNDFYENEKRTGGLCTCEREVYGFYNPAYINNSWGETYILKFLQEETSLPYRLQYRFSDCRDKNPLPFDFAILNGDGSIKFLLEYDGEQHFYPMKFKGGEERFKETQLHDQLKNEYCKEHNIKLIRISYKDNLKEKLKEVFYE